MAITAITPANGALNVLNSATLNWNDNAGSTSFRVYFGTNEADVTAKSNDVFRGTVTELKYDPRLDLIYGANYYWRITAIKDGFPDVDSAVFSFRITQEAATLPDAKNYFKIFCAASDNKFWYENSDSPPKMVSLGSLTIGGHSLDTSKPLSMIELNQCVYIANDTIFRVVDFVNTKLTLNAEMEVPPRRGSIISQSNSNAQMVVDFVAKGSLTVIYGRTITAAKFTTNINDTLSGDTLSPVTRYPTIVTEPLTPHFYEWTVYADVTTQNQFGTIALRAGIGFRWRGRAGLTGNSIDPQQWYLPEPTNPYNWAYAADNALSPVAGTDSKAGKVGDIVTAAIPYTDDYLIFGSIGSLWILRGDPADGGTLDLLDSGIGIVSNSAWCYDDAGNLFILDLKGLYQITGLQGRNPLTSDVIPNFTKDLHLNPNTQRIVLSFDPDRYGIKISVTEIETGTNQNYWYDLQSQGFFPEVYPKQCGVMCSLYYNADDPNKRKLYYGCWDGQIKVMDEAAKSDDIGTVANPAYAAIDSSVLLGPVIMNGEHGYEAKLNTLLVVTAGGKPDGSIPDSDDIDYEIFVADTAEGVVEKYDAEPRKPIFKGTIKAPGVNRLIRKKSKGVFMGVRLGNKLLEKTWGVERVVGEILPAGRLK